jgi:ribokinase
MGRQIVVVGSLNADLCVSVPRFPEPGETIAGRDFRVVPGGKGANQACAAGRLGGQVSMIGQVGDDAQGAMLKASLRSAGVGVDGVLVDPGAATGVALITIDAGGENQIVLGRSGRPAWRRPRAGWPRRESSCCNSRFPSPPC